MSKFGLLFLMVMAYGCYVTITAGPVIGIYLYELVYFLRPENRWWGRGIPSLSYSFLVVLLTLAMFVVHYKKVSKTSMFKVPEFMWMTYMMIVYIGVYFVSVNSLMHKIFLTELIKQFVVFYLFVKLIDDRRKLQIALMTYLVGCAYIGWEAYRVGRNAYGRVEGIGMVDAPDSNGTAACLVSAIPILIYFFWRLEMKWKIVVAVLGAVIANGLVLLNSRGAFLGAVAGAGFILLHMVFSKYKLPKQRLMVAFILLSSAFAVVQVTDDAFWDRMATIKSSASKDSEASGGKRINYWLATFDMLEDYPLGVGIYGFQTLSTQYLTEERFFDTHKHGGEKIRAVHSTWFQALSEIGWIGFFIFITLLYKLWSRLKYTKNVLINQGSYHNYYLVVAVQAGLIAFLVAGTFIDAFRQVILYWFIAFCIAASLIFNPENKKEAKKAPTKGKENLA